MMLNSSLNWPILEHAPMPPASWSVIAPPPPVSRFISKGVLSHMPPLVRFNHFRPHLTFILCHSSKSKVVGAYINWPHNGDYGLSDQMDPMAYPQGMLWVLGPHGSK